MTLVTTDASDAAALAEFELYYDAVPRSGARAEDFGPLTLFVRDPEGAGFPYYARPTRGWTGARVTVEVVERVRARQRELGVPETFEWVPETAPDLRPALEESGLVAQERPLMLLDDRGAVPAPHPLVRLLRADDAALPGALAVPHLAFAELGTAVGTAGADELAAMIASQRGDGSVERIAGRIRAGQSVVAAAVEDGVVLCSGQYLPVGTVTEIVGIGTLPSARRRGLAVSVTAALTSDARSRGIDTIFLTATDEAVARIYARAGFRHIGTAMEAAVAE
ncbi:GNAT family N-acetyltransferase [Streptomyces sp. 21So2-11]|uniref:GNAT family N-acetyltransferase n=1 Tax=Streptomyces sp. 21So2-11 TaxID=3144408 RepID=UPI00321A7A54